MDSTPTRGVPKPALLQIDRLCFRCQLYRPQLIFLFSAVAVGAAPSPRFDVT